MGGTKKNCFIRPIFRYFLSSCKEPFKLVHPNEPIEKWKGKEKKALFNTKKSLLNTLTSLETIFQLFFPSSLFGTDHFLKWDRSIILTKTSFRLLHLLVDDSTLSIVSTKKLSFISRLLNLQKTIKTQKPVHFYDALLVSTRLPFIKEDWNGRSVDRSVHA